MNIKIELETLHESVRILVKEMVNLQGQVNALEFINRGLVNELSRKDCIDDVEFQQKMLAAARLGLKNDRGSKLLSSTVDHLVRMFGSRDSAQILDFDPADKGESQ